MRQIPADTFPKNPLSRIFNSYSATLFSIYFSYLPNTGRHCYSILFYKVVLILLLCCDLLLLPISLCKWLCRFLEIASLYSRVVYLHFLGFVLDSDYPCAVKPGASLSKIHSIKSFHYSSWSG